VQGVIAEYEKAKIAERYRRGKLFRARAGEVTTWKTASGYRRVARSAATGPAHLEIYEPEAAVVRRIFADRAAGTTVREICRSLNADRLPSPTGKATWAHSTLSRLLRNEAYVGRVYFDAPNRCPTGGRHAALVRCHAAAPTGSRSTAPASSPTTCLKPPGGSQSTTLNGALAEPNPGSVC
jgi:site-specific DNA recombinase